jgi:hypothetical protein
MRHMMKYLVTQYGRVRVVLVPVPKTRFQCDNGGMVCGKKSSIRFRELKCHRDTNNVGHSFYLHPQLHTVLTALALLFHDDILYIYESWYRP